MWQRRNNVSLYVSNETLNHVSMQYRQDVSVVCLHDVLLVCHDDVSREHNDDVTSARLHDVSNKSETTDNVTVVRLHHVWELRCCDAFLYYGLYYIFKLVSHDLHLVGFQVSFTCHVKHHIFLVPTRRETRGVVWIIN